MSYTQKTFDALQTSVLKSMDKLGLEPVELASLDSFNATALAQDYAEKYLHLSLTYSDKNKMKKLRALVSPSGRTLCRFNMVGSPQLEDEELRFTYTLDYDKQDSLYLQKRSKRGVSLGRVLGDFDDGLRLNLRFEGGGYVTTSHGLDMLNTLGMPQSELTKYFINKFKAKSKSAYVYFTDTGIDKHYKSLSQTRDLDTCLSRKNSHYKRKVNDVYYHPLKIMNNSPNIRIALIAEKHHDDWVEGEYPFVGRCLVKMSKAGTVTGISRYYGHEKFSREALCNQFKTHRGMKGGLLKAVYDDDNELILLFADQLGDDADEKNGIGWIDSPSERWFNNSVGEEFKDLRTRKDMLLMGRFDNFFEVIPSYDGKEVTSCRDYRYIRNDRPKPNRYKDYIHTLEYGVLLRDDHEVVFNAPLQDYVLCEDVSYLDKDNNAVSHFHKNQGLYVCTVFGDWVPRGDVFLIVVDFDTRYVPKDNTLGLSPKESLTREQLSELLAAEVAA